jgi:iron complex outermembrane recepter protein
MQLLTAAIASAVSVSLQANSILEETIITAQKREQSLQDVGVSVTALSSDQMENLGITDSVDIAKAVPGVVFASTSSGGLIGSISIRGIAQSDFSPNQESPNAIYIDEVYISSSAAASFPLYDLERVEVLRGPQGTLFGRNSTGGLAHFITAKPTDTFEGYAEAGYGDFNQYSFEGAISGPLSDTMRGRLAGRYEKTDGWWENRDPGGEDFFDKETIGVRGHLEVDLTDSLMARLSLSYDKKPRTKQGTYKIENFYIDGNGQPLSQPADLDAYGTGPGNNLVGYRDTFSNGPKNAADNTGFLKNKRVTPTLALFWEGDSVSFTSVTNYTDFSVDYAEECDGSPILYCEAPLSQDLKQWSQELRLTGDTDDFVWTAGLYYLNIDNEDIRLGFNFPILSGGDFAFNDFNDVTQETESYAIFGQIETNLTENVRFTAGARYTYDKKKFDSKVYFIELGNGYEGGTGSTVFVPPLLVYDYSPATVGNEADDDENLWSGKLQLDYTPNDDTLLYAGISRGVKGAGYNTNLGAAITIEETPFDSETVYSYELGWKTQLLDGLMRFNGSVYYNDYQDYQGFAFNGVQGVVGNYDGTFYGFEMETLASLPYAIDVRLGISYIDSELEDIPTAYNGVRDQDAVLAPEWIANGSISKSIDVGENLLSMFWDFSYLDERYASVDNNEAVYVEDSLVQDVRVSYNIESSGIALAAFVNNVTDENTQVFAYDLISTGGYKLQSFSQPRWWGVSVRKSF